MREGKVSQAVLDRSVLRVIKNKNDLVALGGGIGRDSSILKIENQYYAAMDSRSVVVDSLQKLNSTLLHLINHIACGGCTSQAVMLSILFPQDGEEKFLKQIMEEVESVCSKFKMQIMGGHTTVCNDIKIPIVTFTVIGTESMLNSIPLAKSNQDIVITKWIGLEGSSLLAEKYKDVLSKRLPRHIIDSAIDFNKLICTYEEALFAYKEGVSLVHDAAEGGIFAGLWEFAYASDIGIRVDIKKIPIRQETVEVCECLKINPYELLSTGSLIIASNNGEELCRKLLEKGIFAANVGRTTNDNDRVLINEDEVRHLTPAALDNIYQMVY